jgi:hypothetical protein
MCLKVCMSHILTAVSQEAEMSCVLCEIAWKAQIQPVCAECCWWSRGGCWSVSSALSASYRQIDLSRDPVANRLPD